MAIPPVEVKVTADVKQAEAGLNQVESKIDGVGDAATRASGKTAALTQSSSKMSQGMANGSHSVRMMSMQLSQVAQQTQAGGGFMRALAIQLPDIGLAFGTVGIAAGVVGGVLLQTLIPAIQGAMGASFDFEGAVDDLNMSITKLNKPIDILEMSLDDLNEKYGGNRIAHSRSS